MVAVDPFVLVDRVDRVDVDLFDLGHVPDPDPLTKP